MIDKFKAAYKWQKTNAIKRGVEFLLTFDEWKKWWLDTGKWELRGVGKDRYCMCRFNDSGAYALGNIYCATNSKNLSDANKGKPKTSETKLKMSNAAKGKEHPWSKGTNNPMHRIDVKKKFSKATGGANHYKSKTVASPFGVFGSTYEASKQLNISAVTIQWRCKNNKAGWSYLAIA